MLDRKNYVNFEIWFFFVTVTYIAAKNATETAYINQGISSNNEKIKDKE